MWKLYKNHRVVHINVNITIAAIGSVLLSSFFVYFTKYITNNHIEIVILSYLFDAFLDITLFSILHSLLHHKWIMHKKLGLIFAKDIVKIQKQRLFLAPVASSISIFGQLLLLKFGLGRTLAFIISYSSGVVAARVVHTIYGLKTGLFKPIHHHKNL